MTEMESPGEEFIRPCRCSGTLKYVHSSCLRNWRSTSTNAMSRCSVCRFEYETTKNHWFDTLNSAQGMVAVSASIIFLGVIISGWTILQLTQFYNGDIIQTLCRDIHLSMSWRDRRYHLSRSNIKFNLDIVCRGSFKCISIEILLLGGLFVGLLGIISGLFHEASEARRNGHDFIQILKIVALPCGWLLSLGSQSRTRVILALGGCLAAREVYNYVIMRSRMLALYIGDVVLDVNDNVTS